MCPDVLCWRLRKGGAVLRRGGFNGLSNGLCKHVVNSSCIIRRDFDDANISANESFEPLLLNQAIVAMGTHVDMFIGGATLM